MIDPAGICARFALLLPPASRGAKRVGSILASALDGLFTKDKFCLTRQGVLALLWRCSPRGADRQTPKAGAAVPRGSCPLGVGHEATALDGGAGPSQPPGSRAAVGPGLPAASVNARRGSGRPRGRHSDRHIGGESPCR